MGVLAALHLGWLGERPLEVELAEAAHVISSLLHNVTKRNLRMAVHFGSDRVSTLVVFPNVAGAQVIVKGLSSFFFRFRVLRITANKNIHNDLIFSVPSIEALIDGACHVDIDDGAAVHEGSQTPVMVREYERNRCGADGCVR